MLSSEDTLVIAEADSELKSLYDVYEKAKTLFDTLKNEHEANSSLNILDKMMKVNRNMTEILLLIQVKTKRSIRKRQEEIVELQSQIASKSEPQRKVTKTRSQLFNDKNTRKTNGRQSYYFQRDRSHHKHTYFDYETILKDGHNFLSCLPPTKSWRSSDAEELLDGVFHSIKLEKLDKLSSILRTKHKHSDEKLLSLEQELNTLKDASSFVEGFSITNFLSKEPADRDYDWNWISKKYLKNRFSPEECERVWHLVAKPSISKDEWTPEEDLFLRRMAMKNAFQNWSAVNEELPKCRSEFVCFVRYQTVFKKKRSPLKTWTSKENARFDIEVRKPSFSFSHFVSKFIPFQDKSKNQVVNHFRYRQRMRKKKSGLFSNRERFLVSSFVARGYSYGAIAQILGSRTSRQIKEYHLTMKGKLNRGPWNTHEILNLLRAVKYLGEHNWARISKSVEGRSSTQCRHKFAKLKMKNKEMIENDFKRNARSNKIEIARIKKFLKNEKRVKMSNSKNKRKSVDWKIESYFVQSLQEKTKSKGTDDEILFSESIFSLLKYLNFNVPREIEFPKEIFTWLTRDLASNSSALPFDDIFQECFSPVKNNEFRCCGRYSFFSSVLSKSVQVLPPNRCTINGFNLFSKNYEAFAGSNENVNFGEVWKKIDARAGKRKEFLEAKIQWYRIFKAMFYWPIKLKSISPEQLLQK
ncbi:hypothetical protein V9T40_005741 [Parthenolecanium corni]|uniref:snRNA-activating protein complex subunit 4 n=1 Tax=Parthenolecanium corni TaxID=536013 RepID=A0AAN9TX61_9HEMI